MVTLIYRKKKKKYVLLKSDKCLFIITYDLFVYLIQYIKEDN